MFITNSIEIAQIAQKAGVDRIWVDLEWIGKEERQRGMNTVKSHHTIDDVKRIRKVVTKSELMVRVNPIYSESRKEIEDVIQAGADVIMLPMFKTIREVHFFLDCVNKRAKTVLLIETTEAVNLIDELIKINEIDEFHVGLNDLSIAMKKKFMFDLIEDGTIENIADKLKSSGKPYGFGGIARIGKGLVNSEYIIREHFRLGSTRAILSRSFANSNVEKDINILSSVFIEGVKHIRLEEEKASSMSDHELNENKKMLNKLILEVDRNL